MRLILGARLAHGIAVGNVIFAVRHPEPALQQIRGIVLWVVEAGCHPQPEKVGSMKVVDVQGIDIRPQALTQNPGQVVLVANDSNGVEVWAERSEAFGFDGGLVHVRVVEVGDFAGFIARCRILRGLADQVGDPLVGFIHQRHCGKRCPVVRWNLRVLHPLSVGIFVKVIARPHRAVHIRQVNGRARGQRGRE